MKTKLSPQIMGRRDALAALLRKLRSIVRSGLPTQVVLTRLKGAFAEAGTLSRLVTIVPCPGCTATLPRLSFVVDKEMIGDFGVSDPQPAPMRRGCRRGRKTGNEVPKNPAPRTMAACAVAVFEIDDRELTAQGAD